MSHLKVKPWFICQHIATAHLSQPTGMVSDIAYFCLMLTLELRVGWISTLAYETSTNCWPVSFAVVYCNAYCSEKSKKVKESHNRPDVAQRVPGGLGFQIPWHLARKGGEVVSLTHWPPLPPGMFLVLIFTRGWVDPRVMEQLEGGMSLKNPLTPPGIDPGTVRLVAQRLNCYATPGPIQTKVIHNIWR
jgi:hypothetical protein